jgi:DNA polymerase-3 subunit alpha
VADDKIQFGLVAVKNVGDGAVEAIVEERRANGAYASLFDFCERVDLRRVNKRVVESLIACGALDSTGARRSQMMAVLEEALDYGQKVQRERCDPQMGLFDDGVECSLSVTPPPLIQIPEWDEKERLAREKEALGFYISGHPLTRHAKTMGKFSTATTENLGDVPDGQMVRIGGMVASSKVIRTKREELMAFVQLEDLLGSVEVIVFPSVYGACQDLLGDDQPVLVQGKVQQDDKGVKILADTLIAAEQAEKLWTAKIQFNIDAQRTDETALSELRDILRRHPGECQGVLRFIMDNEVEASVAMADNWRLQPGETLTREVNGLLGYSAVETLCGDINAKNGNGNGNGSRGRYRGK